MPEALSPAAPRHVFVYGTLRRGGRNDINQLTPAPRYVGLGEVSGVLYQLGWYPGLVLGGQDAVAVVGEVYEISAALELLLDAIEEISPGPETEYFKRERTIEVQGEAFQCLVYEINPDRVLGHKPMAHGDWASFHAGDAPSRL